MQLEVSPDGITVLNDAYNASPSSMHAALRSLAALEPRGRRVAVLGDMLELGHEAADAHAALGPLAHDAGVHLLVAVGPHSAAAADEAARKGVAVLTARDRDEARGVVLRHVRPGDAVLVKASRAVGLESIAEAILRGERDG
jgi:UDP-N-acetylmuramoyl-tripeptide--D-alanyl-D-alanine ligase